MSSPTLSEDSMASIDQSPPSDDSSLDFLRTIPVEYRPFSLEENTSAKRCIFCNDTSRRYLVFCGTNQPNTESMGNYFDEMACFACCPDPCQAESSAKCTQHQTESLNYFCSTCNVAICGKCIVSDHHFRVHKVERFSEAGPKQLDIIRKGIQEERDKAQDMKEMTKTLEDNTTKIQVQYHKARNEINETFKFYQSMLEERKQELLKDLEDVYSGRYVQMSLIGQKAQKAADNIDETCDTIERVTETLNWAQLLMFKKSVDDKLQELVETHIDESISTCEFEFVSNYQAIQVAVRNTFGYVRSKVELTNGPNKQPPIARPSTSLNSSVNNIGNELYNASVNGETYSNSVSPSSTSPGLESSPRSIHSLDLLTQTLSDLNINGANPYDKWSSGSNDQSLLSPEANLLNVATKLMAIDLFLPKPQIKRKKMIYHCKFGDFGIMEGHFTEPSGVAVNAQNDIIVADTNNHRVQIFDKDGRFKFQFGECGRQDGQLLYPNRVAVDPLSGDIIITERSPTHQIQIYNQYGQFSCKFGSYILQHPRGVTVDYQSRIIVVECKVMRVIIFNQTGIVLQNFSCSKYLEFPNDIVVNKNQEIFISDNRAHCVKVFNYDGVYLRQIGGEGVTNYPIGVGINSAGFILIADNHNNFNLTIFTQEGELVSALESKVKHAQCLDIALMNDCSVVLACKDYRLFIYRYVPVPPFGL